MLFSIIIPTFNSEKVLAKALESVLEQTFTNYEILILDGQSTDNTLEIAKNYKDERIKIYSEKDCGVYDAMNKGISLSQGELLYFLGSDDKFHDKFILEKVLDAFNANLHVIYGNVYRLGRKILYDGEFDATKLYHKNICHQAIFYKKEVFTKIGKFNLDYKITADWEHNIKWFFNGEINKKFIPITICDYADNGLSTSITDHRFYFHKNYIYLKNANKFVPNKIKNQIYREELVLFLRHLKRALKFFIYKLLHPF